jgi:argininosuccinate lyase
MASSITRVVDSLIIWSTSEFGMIDMPDSYGYTSSIMPQKRNPGYFLESVRSKSARITGELTSAMCTLKGTTFAQSRDTSFEITIPAFRAFAEAVAILNVMKGVVTRMIVNSDAMQANCASEFSGATEIANLLVKERGLDFRSAYLVVANTVRIASEQGMRPKDVRASLMDEVAVSSCGQAVHLTDAQVRMALDPARNVELKRTLGGPAAMEVRRMIDVRFARLEKKEQEHLALIDRLDAAASELDRTMAASIEGARALGV